MKAQRQQWMARLADACDGDFSRVLFLDETGALTNLTRTHGRCEQGERCIGHAPAGHWQTMTAVAAIRLEGLTAAATTPHAIDGELFLGYVEHALLPALRPGDVVVMDNLPAHKGARVAAAIEGAGCRLACLPPYSPDFSPIEPMWSKVKQHLRSAKPRTDAALIEAMGEALRSVTAADAQGYFEHCGCMVH